MPNYATPPTAIAGNNLSAADWNTKIRDSMEALAKPSRCKVVRAAQSIPNNAMTSISWTSEDYDVDGFWAVGAPTDLVIPKTGLYLATFNCGFAANATGVRQFAIFLNAFNLVQSELIGSATGGVATTVSIEQVANAGDILTFRAFQNSGAALNTNTPRGTVRLVAV